MDDLELRRRLYADPNDKDPQISDALTSSPSNQQFAGELKQLDGKISSAVKVPVPEGLAERLILSQSMEQFRQQRKRSRVHLALAASIAFAVGISFSLLKSTPQHDFNVIQHSLAHVYGEADHLDGIDEGLRFQQVNSKLAKLGGQLEQDIGHVYFANFCDFDGTRSLHLIVDDDSGHRVTVFFVPDNKRPVDEQFNDGKMAGSVHHFTDSQGQGMSMVVLSEPNAQIKTVEQRLQKSLRWQNI
ncbi:DUF3379 family protein [Corallincola spongiicola]|uniref:DUF3379 domain-containing protein n=1 Tax=Corallincola spongiicola TaxID=2520508 RepID=A0ABY1WNA9_9GAMM|nr:DUF3379 family protein [Corallincola spongiicola]TAA43787.1 DUF3379 domain-containing protein [Corallincola spongiicola]